MREGDLIILVHGTFARSASWVENQSDLAMKINRSTPGLTVKPFRWTGRNSYADRMRAGEQLAHEIKSAALGVNAKVHLVGHSHGGNVALYALKDQVAMQRIASIAFLGTPFFNFRKRDFKKNVSFIGTAFSWLVIPTLLCILGILFAATRTVDSSSLGSISYLFLYLAVFSTVLVFVWYVFGEGSRARLRDKITNLLQTRLAAAALRLSQVQVVPSQPVFIAWTDRDEARVWLRTLGRATAIPVILTRYVVKYTAFIFSLVGGTLGILFLLPDDLLFFLPIPDWFRQPFVWFNTGVLIIVFIISMCISIAAVAVPPLTTIISVAIRGHQLGFGWEGLLGYQAADISVSNLPNWELPPGSAVLRVDTNEVRGWRHSSFYASDEVADSLIAWLTGLSPRS
jgi:pimeloyl-ACP methyl ester carboxylesterase